MFIYFCLVFSVFCPCYSFWWFHELVCKTRHFHYERYLFATWIHLRILTIHPYRNGKLLNEKKNIHKMWVETKNKRILCLKKYISQYSTFIWHEFHTDGVFDCCLYAYLRMNDRNNFNITVRFFHSCHCYLFVVWK